MFIVKADKQLWFYHDEEVDQCCFGRVKSSTLNSTTQGQLKSSCAGAQRKLYTRDPVQSAMWVRVRGHIRPSLLYFQGLLQSAMKVLQNEVKADPKQRKLLQKVCSVIKFPGSTFSLIPVDSVISSG